MLKAGQVLNGRYEIRNLLGQGGMGAVYRAFDRLFDRDVALKEFCLGDLPSEAESFPHTDQTVVRNSQPVMLTREKAMQQFFAEAKLLAKLEHPNLPKVSDFFNLGFEGYLAMTLIEGSSLEKILADNAAPLAEDTVQAWLLQVMDALDYCHRMDVIHRDLKPANLLLSPGGLVYLVDFGIAKSLVAGQKETSTGARAYSPGFAPPEQYSGRGGTNPASDIYSLGATAYALLTATTPVEPNDQIAGEILVPPRSLNPLISQRMEKFILSCMQLKKTDRPQTILAARDLLLSTPEPPHIESHTRSSIVEKVGDSKPIQPLKVQGPISSGGVTVPPLKVQGSVSSEAAPVPSPVKQPPVQPIAASPASPPVALPKPKPDPAKVEKPLKARKKTPAWLIFLLLGIGLVAALQIFAPEVLQDLFSGGQRPVSTLQAEEPVRAEPTLPPQQAGTLSAGTGSSETRPAGTNTATGSCPVPDPAVAINSHSVTRNWERNFTYKAYFTNSSGWGENGSFSFSLTPMSPASSFYCGTQAYQSQCTVMSSNPDLLFCQQSLSFSIDSARNSSSVYCDYEIRLEEANCAELHTYRYAYEFPVQ